VLLVKNAQIVTMNDAGEVLNGDVLISGDRIAAVGEHLAGENCRIINAQGKTVIPGFVQTHVHLCQTLFRGQADGMKLSNWLKTRIWPLEAAHDDESIYYSALLGVAELIAGGTTTVMDMETVHHTDAAFRALAQSGMRAIAGKAMMDTGGGVPPALLEDTSASLATSVKLLEAWHNYDDGRIRYAFAPRFLASCTDQMLVEVGKLARQYGVMVQTHAAENKQESAKVAKERGLREVLYYDRTGLTGANLMLAHCIWLEPGEMQVLKTTDTRVSHCPGANMKLGSGFADVDKMLAEGIKVGLGADGAPCNNTLDMFNEMRLAALVHKPESGPGAMSAHTVMRMATIGGAEAIGLGGETGSLEVGKKADLAIVNLNHPHSRPAFSVDPVSQLVYTGSSHDVEMTIINGKVVWEKGDFATIDWQDVRASSEICIQRLLNRIGAV
jgi:cytosine/adenosine deaminase-related metal-dependent hydrolase